MYKLIAILFGVVMLAGCSFMGSEEDAMEAETPEVTMEEELVDAEVEAIVDEEAAIDAQLDELEESL